MKRTLSGHYDKSARIVVLTPDKDGRILSEEAYKRASKKLMDGDYLAVADSGPEITVIPMVAIIS